ncbi:MAG: MG2 domain-containing protein, partial [Flavobacteriales bacterium]|nr:MG2 domain-containing protein [Flavobacteriales bacterium]
MISKTIIKQTTGFIASIAMIILFSCSGNKQASNAYNYYEYIYAYTNGTVSRTSSIYISFADNVVDQDMVNQEVKSGVLEIRPNIEGKATWSSTSSIQFVPDDPLDYSTNYQAIVKLDKLIPEIPDSLDEFVFDFETRDPYVSLSVEGLTNLSESNLTWQQLTGTLNMTDFENLETIQKIVSAKIGGEDLKIRWELNNDNYVHRFIIDSIRRTDENRSLVLEWDGSPINFDQEGKETYQIMAAGVFNLVSAQTPTGTAQEVILEFSDPINKSQNLQGLITLNGRDDIEYRVDKNKIYVYPKFRLIGNVEIRVNKNLKNTQGDKLGNQATQNIAFSEIKPQLRLIGEGTIVPQSGAVPFPFEAVNLNAVDVRVIKVFSKSVPQFLQVNEMAGSNELKRVGHLVALKKVRLDQDKSLDLKAWNKHVIDLNNIISAEPGAIYEISLGFRKSYSMYACSDSTASSSDNQSMLELPDDWNEADAVEEDDSYWDYYEEDYDYDYPDRDEPCKLAYYYDGRVVKRNVLASNLGIIAKSGPLGDMTIAVTDIRTTDPKGGTEIEIYSFQQALLRRTTTNSDGVASFNVKGKPFLVVAKSGSQRGYLKVNDANALSISRFDVSGSRQKEGINGFLYTERGVWRPGDSIYVNLMLQDDANKLPHNHPVRFELFDPSGQLVEERVTKKHLNRLYNFFTATTSDAPTGNYLAKVTVGGTTFTKSLKVETIMPNRLKLDLDFGKEYIAKGMDDLDAELAVTWLHGAIAKNLDADVSVNLTSARTKFSRFEDFIFDDPSRKFTPEDKTIYDGTLDGDGKATVSAEFSVDGEAPGMLTANFKARAFEPGGNFSTERFSIPYHPYENYVGLKLPKGDKARGMLLTDTNHIVQIATVDPAGQPTSGREVSVQVFKLDWKWWWDKSANDVDFNGTYYGTPVTEGIAKSKDGIAKWKLRVNYPSWGRYLVRACDDESGHCASKVIYMDWPGWAGRGQKDNMAGANMLTFTADKKEYVVGEEITLNLPTPQAGRAFVSIERQNKVIETYWVNTTKGTTRFTFDANASMAPNVFANVTLLQPHGQTKNSLPIRLFGVIPIKVVDPATQLSPMLAMNDVLEPESDVEIEVREENGKGMTYTLALVD